MSKFYIILIAISVVQFSVAEPFCGYDSIYQYIVGISINCEGLAFVPEMCDKDLISTLSYVSIKNCEIGEWSDIFNQFPNLTILVVYTNSTLPSIELLPVGRLNSFVFYDSKFKKTSSSLLSMDATNLETFMFGRNQSDDIDTISLKNATELKHFMLENATMTNVPANLFENSTKLMMAHLPFNKIESIDAANWPFSLTSMDLGSNQITQLTKRSFGNLGNLIELYLDANKINDIESGTFYKLKNLSYLVMNENQIEKINKNTFEGLVQLKILYLANNRIETIENGAIDIISNLKILDLSKNKISSLNQLGISESSRLSILNLAENPIREIDTNAFAHFDQLMTLNMSSGQLGAIDFNAFAKKLNLIDLDLSNNNISRLVKIIPNSIKEFKREKSNPIKRRRFRYTFSPSDVASGWFTVDKFGPIRESLSLLNRYKAEFPEIHELKYLILSGNQLTLIERNIFAEFKNLRELFLSRNPITTLYPESFAGLNNLRILYMDHCKLKTFDFSILSHMDAINILDFSHNQMTTIAAVLVPPRMKELRLNNNRLGYFPLKFDDIRTIDLLDVKNNNNNLTCSNLETFNRIELYCSQE